MSYLNDAATLELHPVSNPRDKRVHERIQEELEPLARDIMQEYKAGLTVAEIHELSRQRKERRKAREKAREAAWKDDEEHAEEVRAEGRKVDPEVRERVAELVDAGPVRWAWIRRRLRSEGITWSDVQPLAGDDAFSIQRAEDGRWIQRA